jgi:hypothetical protein
VESVAVVDALTPAARFLSLFFRLSAAFARVNSSASRASIFNSSVHAAAAVVQIAAPAAPVDCRRSP